MSISHLSPGRAVPDELHVVIEIPAGSDPVKYEVDKKTGMVMVDRFVATSMVYPCNYGFVPGTLSEDGDPVDVLVVTPYPLYPGVVIACRPVGMLRMTDESGPDAKVLAVPLEKLTPHYAHMGKPEDLGVDFLASVSHFFQHYKDLESGKWVKIDGWEGVAEARTEIMAAIDRYADVQNRS